MEISKLLNDFIMKNQEYKQWKYIAFNAHKMEFELTDQISPIFDLITNKHLLIDENDFWIDDFIMKIEHKLSI